MNTFSRVPPGFRFHPTDEELVDYYLRKKVSSWKIDLDVIKDVDLYKIEPWDLQELCRISTEEQQEWYFFSHKDKKYPTGTRTNRATTAGFWKATGRDKAIYSKHDLIGMRKTLVFYQGRAPNGLKSDWIMHEYRLETDENGPPQEEGWVVCRVFKKRMPNVRRLGDHGSPCWYDDSCSFMPDLESPNQNSNPNCNLANFHPLGLYGCKKELDLHYQFSQQQHLLMQQLPVIDNPKLLLAPVPYIYGLDINQSTFHGQPSSSMIAQDQNLLNSLFGNNNNGSSNLEQDQVVADDQITDWRVLDKFVASQLSQEDNHDEVVPNVSQNKQETAADQDVSMQTSASCEIIQYIY